jgi:hypothetical protein
MKPILGDLPKLGRAMARDLAVTPLLVVTTFAVANGAFKVLRDTALMPDAHFSIQDRSSMWGARTEEEEAHKRSARYYEHSVKDAAVKNYHNNLKRYGIDEADMGRENTK